MPGSPPPSRSRQAARVLPATLPCPTCRAPVAVAADPRPATFPFCSSRCRNRDLGEWADGAHVIPGQPVHELLDDGYGALDGRRG